MWKFIVDVEHNFGGIHWCYRSMAFTHLQRRFSCFSYHYNRVFPVINEYIWRIVRPYYDVIVDVLSMQTAFSGIICGDHIDAKEDLYFQLKWWPHGRGIGKLFNCIMIPMVKAMVPMMYTYYLSILKKYPIWLRQMNRINGVTSSQMLIKRNSHSRSDLKIIIVLRIDASYIVCSERCDFADKFDIVFFLRIST